MKATNAYSKINESSEMDFSETICDLTSARDAVRQIKNSDGGMEAQGGYAGA